MTYRFGPSAPIPTSKRTWSLPLPVQPCATWSRRGLGGLDEVLDDQRAADGRDQRVLVHVQGVGLDRRQAVLVGELIASVDHDRLDRTAVESALAHDVHVLAALAEIDRDRDDFGSGLLADPADATEVSKPPE